MDLGDEQKQCKMQQRTTAATAGGQRRRNEEGTKKWSRRADGPPSPSFVRSFVHGGPTSRAVRRLSNDQGTRWERQRWSAKIDVRVPEAFGGLK